MGRGGGGEEVEWVGEGGACLGERGAGLMGNDWEGFKEGGMGTDGMLGVNENEVAGIEFEHAVAAATDLAKLAIAAVADDVLVRFAFAMRPNTGAEEAAFFDES